MSEVRLSPDLPEHFACLYHKDLEKFETPLDSRGIADIDAVFELAAWTFPGDLRKALHAKHNKHHLYWTEKWWQDFADEQATELDRLTVLNFRDSTPQKAYVPKPIHSWIESSQLQPPAPSLDVMRRRNNGWASASLLLKSCIDLDKARDNYANKKGIIRIVLGNIEGITPVSARRPEQYIEVVDDEYWLSELNSHLDSWHRIAESRGNLPVEEGILATPRLSDVRSLHRRVRPGAVIPRLPSIVLAA
jgi:hypothetical protein